MGHNGGPPLDGAGGLTLEGKLRKIMVLHNRAAHDKRKANEELREAVKKFNVENADFVRAIEEAVRTAKEDLRDARETKVTGFAQWTEDKKDASRRQREAMKMAKEFGLDIQAFKKFLQMSQMDPVERAEHFDAIDQYCKACSLWGGSDFV